MTTNAAVGSLAPDFDLPSTAAIGRSRLADYRGRWLVLIFYPRDFSLVCPTELTAIGARIEEFRAPRLRCLGGQCRYAGIAPSLDCHAVC